MDRLRLATVWFGGCSGCHMSFFDLDEWLIDLSQRAELVYSPAVDTKVYPEKVDVCLIEGAICNEDHLEMIHRIRNQTKILVAFGDCAVTGNVTALRNALGSDNVENVLQRAYEETADVNPQLPEAAGIVPRLLPRVMPVHEVVRVEHYLPGCPPPASRIRSVLEQLLAGNPPNLIGKDLKFG